MKKSVWDRYWLELVGPYWLFLASTVDTQPFDERTKPHSFEDWLHPTKTGLFNETMVFDEGIHLFWHQYVSPNGQDQR